jgi:hypothetical protein
VVGNFGIETQVVKVLGDDGRLQFTITETFARCLVVVEFLKQLVKTPL